MASTREERMQQRLRGAQRRQVKDVDFGLTFAPAPAPTQSPAPARRNSQPELAPQLSTRPTQGSNGSGRPSSAAEKNNQLPYVQSMVDANTSAKRRKLDTDQMPSSSTRTTRSSMRQDILDIYALNEDELEPIAADNTNNSVGQTVQVANTPEPDTSMSIVPNTSLRTPSRTMGREEEEITESPMHAPGSGQRVQMVLNKAAMQSSLPQDELLDDDSAAAGREATASPASQRKRKRSQATPKHAAPDAARSRRIRSSQPNSAVDEVDELSPEQPKPSGRKPKSTVQEQLSEEEVSTEPVDEAESAQEIDDEEAAVILKKNRGRRISRNATPKTSTEEDEIPVSALAVTKERSSKLHPTFSPAKQRHPKGTKSKAAPRNPKKLAKNKQVRIGSPIPVTVHRLTKRPLYNEDESDADILNSEVPYARRGGVNAIDVLSQVCQEIIDSALHTLEDGGTSSEVPALRREYRNKYRAVESFGKELQTRLLEHTINLDNTFSLEKRVREEQKKKIALRNDILRVRAERQQVALRMDEIRIKHEKESKDARELDTLNNSIHDIELAIENGKTKKAQDASDGPVEMVGIELLLQRIAGEVSNKSDSGGMLKQIRDFNAFLERAALALEDR